jgi:oligoribonuclease
MRSIFLDSETTGLDPQKHRVIDIAFKIIDVSTGELIASYQSIVKQPYEDWEKHDPISVQINGYTWEKIVTGKTPEVVSQEIIKIFTEAGIQRGKAFFICQNPAFDRGFFTQLIDVYTQEKLNWPYHWLDLASMYWALLVQKHHQGNIRLPETMNLSKNEIAKACNLPPEVEPHLAINGVDHLIQCYSAVLGEHFIF